MSHAASTMSPAQAELQTLIGVGSGTGLGVTVKYKTIVADPPWDVKAGPRSLHDPNEPSRPLKYPTMSVEKISAIQVPADDDAHLYIWTINAYIEETYAIARAWGFKPSTLLTWCKKPKGRGLGGTFSTATEFVLFARRGTLAAKQRCDRNWWEWSRGKHSAKPEAFQDMVESVSPGPYLELFARRTRLGWHTWGNQALCHVNLVPSNDELKNAARKALDCKQDAH